MQTVVLKLPKKIVTGFFYIKNYIMAGIRQPEFRSHFQVLLYTSVSTRKVGPISLTSLIYSLVHTDSSGWMENLQGAHIIIYWSCLPYFTRIGALPKINLCFLKPMPFKFNFPIHSFCLLSTLKSWPVSLAPPCGCSAICLNWMWLKQSF